MKFKLWLEFELWERDQKWNPYNDFFNMQIDLEDGNKYALNVWTFEYFDSAVKEIEIVGDNLNGKYLEPPDLFIKKLDRKLCENVVSDLIKNNALKKEWLIIED